MKDKNNQLLSEQEKVAERLREYFCDLLTEPNTQMNGHDQEGEFGERGEEEE